MKNIIVREGSLSIISFHFMVYIKNVYLYKMLKNIFSIRSQQIFITQK